MENKFSYWLLGLELIVFLCWHSCKIPSVFKMFPWLELTSTLFGELEVPIPFQLKLDYRVTRQVVPYVLLISKQKLHLV